MEESPLSIRQWIEAALAHDGRYTIYDIVKADRRDDESGDVYLKFDMNDGEMFPLKLSVARQ